MLDPGALGTLIIGLDAVRQEHEVRGDAVERRHRKPFRPAVRLGLVNGLRRLADTLEPRPRRSSSG